MTKKRIEWIDCVRAVSMMLIIIGHTYAVGFWQYFIFAINVPIFFVLSGYLTRKKSLYETVKGGIKTLIVPYLFTVCVIFLLSLISLHKNIPGLIMTDKWDHYLIAGIYGIGTPTQNSIIPGSNVPAIGAIWFLLAMYFGNIFYQTLRMIVDRKNKTTQNMLLVSLSIILAICGFTISHFIQLPWSLGAAMMSVIFYTSGYLIRQYNLMDINFTNALIAIISFFLWILAAIKGPFWFNTGFAAHPVIDVIGAIGGSYCLMYFIKLISTKLGMHLLAELGRLALITLSIHIICLNLFTDVNFLNTVLVNHHVATLAAGIFTDCYRIAFCWIATIILAKFKWIRKIFAIR